MDLGKYLSHVMESHVVFSLNIFGVEIPIFDTIIVMWIVMAIVIGLALYFTRNLKQVPEGRQNLIELYIEFVTNFTKSTLGHHAKYFVPYFGTVLLFLAIANAVSIFSIIPSGEQLYHLTGIKFFEHIPEFEIRPPTKDINVTVCMAIMSIILVIGAGIRFKTFKGFLKSFLEPVPIILPFKILDYFIRPLSLSLRLFGNILGAFIVMELIYLASNGFVIPAVFSLYFDLFDGLLQAYIFVFLTSIYVAEAIE
ncbi:MAG: F0F1 ATP synthase subunit A [Clostridia bacterium]|nr:F0F1 ATP synthase subunit A [Clostridia bacterium]